MCTVDTVAMLFEHIHSALVTAKCITVYTHTQTWQHTHHLHNFYHVSILTPYTNIHVPLPCTCSSDNNLPASATRQKSVLLFPLPMTQYGNTGGRIQVCSLILMTHTHRPGNTLITCTISTMISAELRRPPRMIGSYKVY